MKGCRVLLRFNLLCSDIQSRDLLSQSLALMQVLDGRKWYCKTQKEMQSAKGTGRIESVSQTCSA